MGRRKLPITPCSLIFSFPSAPARAFSSFPCSPVRPRSLSPRKTCGGGRRQNRCSTRDCLTISISVQYSLAWCANCWGFISHKLPWERPSNMGCERPSKYWYRQSDGSSCRCRSMSIRVNLWYVVYVHCHSIVIFVLQTLVNWRSYQNESAGDLTHNGFPYFGAFAIQRYLFFYNYCSTSSLRILILQQRIKPGSLNLSQPWHYELSQLASTIGRFHSFSVFFYSPVAFGNTI